MKNSYIEEFKNSAPALPPLVNDALWAQVEAAGKLAPQKMFIPKSERIQQLRAEKDLAASLYQRADQAMKAWGVNERNRVDMKGRLPYFSYNDGLPEDPDFPDLMPVVDAHTAQAVEDAKQLIFKMGGTAFAMRDMLLKAYQQIERDLEFEEKGTTGETGVVNYLRRNLQSRILESVVLPSFRTGENVPKTAETDMLVISERGVFVCEIKNYGTSGQSIVVTEDGQMQKQDYYGRVLEHLPSAINQNAWHAYAVRSVLGCAGLSHVPVWEITIIANTDVRIINNSKSCVIDMYQFRDMVAAGSGGASVDEATQNAVFAAIQKERMAERNFPIVTLSPVRNELVNALDMLNNGAANYNAWLRQVATAVDNWVWNGVNRWKERNPWAVRYAQQLEVGFDALVYRIVAGFILVVIAFFNSATRATLLPLVLLLSANVIAIFWDMKRSFPKTRLGYMWRLLKSNLLGVAGYLLLATLAASMLLNDSFAFQRMT